MTYGLSLACHGVRHQASGEMFASLSRDEHGAGTANIHAGSALLATGGICMLGDLGCYKKERLDAIQSGRAPKSFIIKYGMSQQFILWIHSFGARAASVLHCSPPPLWMSRSSGELHGVCVHPREEVRWGWRPAALLSSPLQLLGPHGLHGCLSAVWEGRLRHTGNSSGFNHSMVLCNLCVALLKRGFNVHFQFHVGVYFWKLKCVMLVELTFVWCNIMGSLFHFTRLRCLLIADKTGNSDNLL